MKRLISLLLAAITLFSFCSFASAESNDSLSFNSDGSFTILQISDPQDDHYPAYDMVNLIKLSIEQAKPDLIVFSGDIVEDSRIGDIGIDDEDGREGVEVKDDYDATLKNVKAACAAVFKAAEEANIPFVTTQGNNDYSCGVTNEDWLKIYASYKNCLTVDKSDDAEGRIDCNIEIKSADGKTAFNIWLTDTGRNSVNAEQLAWYKAESARLKAENNGKPVPSILFQHIPVADIGNLFEECNFWDEGASISGSKCYRLNQQIASGYHAGVMVPGKTSEQFTAWKECGDVLGAYFGHWHTEGYTGIWNGIELGFTYGCEFAKTGPYGVRVITVYENDEKNFKNELYTYEGSVTKGNAKLVLQVDKPYTVYDSIIEEIIGGIKNTFNLIIREIKSIFA